MVWDLKYFFWLLRRAIDKECTNLRGSEYVLNTCKVSEPGMRLWILRDGQKYQSHPDVVVGDQSQMGL